MLTKKYYDEINLMKGLAMFLAVVGHALPDATNGFDIAGGVSFASFVFHWIYSFHMSAFFFCAGFLFIPRLPYKKVGETIGKRFRRLMIPYFFYSMTYLVAKTFLSAFAANPLVDHAFGMMFLGVSPSFGCWFLWTLFMISMIFVLTRKVSPKGMLLMGIGLFVLSQVLDKAWMPGRIDRMLSGSLWFALGGWVAVHYEEVKRVCRRPACGVIGFLVLTLLQGVHTDVAVWQSLIGVLKTLGGIETVYCLACFLMERCERSLAYRTTKLIGDYCMDVYLLSMFVLVPLRILYINVGLVAYVNYYVYVAASIALGIWIPYVASKYVVRRYKPLRILLIGG